MGNPLPIGGNVVKEKISHAWYAVRSIKNNKIIHSSAIVVVLGMTARIMLVEPTSYALAYFTGSSVQTSVKSPIFDHKKEVLFAENIAVKKVSQKKEVTKKVVLEKKEEAPAKVETPNVTGNLENKIFELVGDSPIKEMVPFIAKRDSIVAAFLIGIAKKESSFGSASPSKDGKTCYNYWGYKGSAGRGTGMGYACFASAEEAVKIVGDRLEELVSKQRNTPSRMVDTWKCGKSCAGDPGAPGWVSTVTLYFNKIVENIG